MGEKETMAASDVSAARRDVRGTVGWRTAAGDDALASGDVTASDQSEKLKGTTKTQGDHL